MWGLEPILSCAVFASNMTYNWWPPPPHSFTYLVCVTNPKGINDGGNVITISVLHVRTNVFPGSGVNSGVQSLGRSLPFSLTQSDTHSHSVPLLLLNRELSWGPWSFILGKLDPGEGSVGTDVRLQEALEAPGVSMTLASALFGGEAETLEGTAKKEH